MEKFVTPVNLFGHKLYYETALLIVGIIGLLGAVLFSALKISTFQSGMGER